MSEETKASDEMPGPSPTIRSHAQRVLVLAVGSAISLGHWLSIVGVLLILIVGIWALAEWWWRRKTPGLRRSLAKVDVGLAACLFVGIGLWGARHGHTLAQVTHNRNLAKQLLMACQLYADEHDDSYPPHLTMLPEESLTGGDLTLQVRYPEFELDWLYFPPAPDDAWESGTTIVLASPLAWNWSGLRAPSSRSPGKRVVCYLDGRTDLVSEDDYQAAIQAQFRLEDWW